MSIAPKTASSRSRACGGILPSDRLTMA